MLLRGINISGKNRIVMKELKQTLMEHGFSDVVTVGNSGNLILSSEQDTVSVMIHDMIRESFSLDIPVYAMTQERLRKILEKAPVWWNREDPSMYDNLIFILSGDTPETIAGLLGDPSDNLERYEIVDDVIFWTFDRKKYQKCRWWKQTASEGIAERLTIRTANTVLKLLK
ncbi:MAG: DUF1697 domain-containing protein [Bulleidia sp.]